MLTHTRALRQDKEKSSATDQEGGRCPVHGHVHWPLDNCCMLSNKNALLKNLY